MRNNKNLPLIISGVIIFLLLAGILASGGNLENLLSGAAGLVEATATPELTISTPLPEEGLPVGDPTNEAPDPTATATSVPLAPDSNLSISVSTAQVTCRQATFNVSISNSGEKTSATDVELSVQITSGTQYISGNTGANWRIGTVSPGQTKSIQVSFSTNSTWNVAPTGTSLDVTASVRNEGSNPSLNVGKSSSANAGHPGGCAPTSTNTPKPQPTKTPEPPTATPETPQAAVCQTWVLFHSERDGNLELYRLDGSEGASNSKLYNLSKSSAADSSPSRSADGLWIAFQSDRDGNFEIYLTDAAGQSQTRLTNAASDEVNPVFSPDNRSVVYQSDRNGNWDLYIYDRISRQERRLTSAAGDEINPTWSASGQLLAYQSNAQGNWDIQVLNLTDDNIRDLAATSADEVTPVWSPDGLRIAYLLNASGNWQVFYSSPDGKNLTQVSKEGSAAAIAWAPNSRLLAYQSERGGNTGIYSYSLTNAKETRLTSAAGAESAPTWDCTSSNVYYSTNGDIERVNLQGGTPVKVTNNPAGDYNAMLAGSKSFLSP